MKGFAVIYRNFGHWDVVGQDVGRLFRIRGTGDKWLAMDERDRPYPVSEFKTFSSAVLFVMETLMHEDLIPDPQSPGNNILRPLTAPETF